MKEREQNGGCRCQKKGLPAKEQRSKGNTKKRLKAAKGKENTRIFQNGG
jgi:hypothetical protein